MIKLLSIAMVCLLMAGKLSKAETSDSEEQDGLFSEQELADACGIRVKRLQVPAKFQNSAASFVLARIDVSGKRKVLCTHKLEGARTLIFGLTYDVFGKSENMHYAVNSVSGSSSRTSDGTLETAPGTAWSVVEPRWLEDMRAYELARIKTPTNQTTGLIFWYQ